MDFVLSETENSEEEKFVIDSLWKYDAKFAVVDIRPLRIFLKDDNNVLGGLIARTWWGTLDIQFLWITENERKKGVGKKLIKMAEEEAIKRQCHMAYVDTFDFQAVNFYKKLGFEEYGQLGNYAKKYTRHYLSKKLNSNR